MRALALLCLLLTTSTAFAATYVVAPKGDDAGPGSPARPWLTLQHAVDSIAPGDTITVKAGSYAGCRIGRSGEAGAPCVLQAAPGATVQLNAPGAKNGHQSIVEVESYGATVSYWTIDGFEVANSPRYGIDLRGTDHVTVQNCRVHDSAVTGIVTSHSPYVILQDNETFGNHEHGIYHANSADYPVIRRNRSHHNDGCGIHMNGDLSMGGDGQISYAVVEQNEIWENGAKRGGSAINCDGVSDSIFANNLCYDNHASGISLYAGDAAQGSSRNLVYHNTFVMAPGARFVVNIPASAEGKSNPVGNKVINNILMSPDANRGSGFVYDGRLSQLASDFNIVVDRFALGDSETVLPLAKWREAGFDVHSLLSTPQALFVDPAKHDYRLKPNAPARRAGIAVPEVGEDLRGTPRPRVTPPDIGALQYVAPAKVKP